MDQVCIALCRQDGRGKLGRFLAVKGNDLICECAREVSFPVAGDERFKWSTGKAKPFRHGVWEDPWRKDD